MDGQPIEADPERIFVIATLPLFVRGPAAAWEAHAGAHFPEPLFDLAALHREHLPLAVRDLLLAHIAAHGGVLPTGRHPARWARAGVAVMSRTQPARFSKRSALC